MEEMTSKEDQSGEAMLLERLRSLPIGQRINRAQELIGHMCALGRPPRMSVPVQWDDEDFYITKTLQDAADNLNIMADSITKLEAENAALIAQLREQTEKAEYERERANEWLVQLEDAKAQAALKESEAE